MSYHNHARFMEVKAAMIGCLEKTEKEVSIAYQKTVVEPAVTQYVNVGSGLMNTRHPDELCVAILDGIKPCDLAKNALERLFIDIKNALPDGRLYIEAYNKATAEFDTYALKTEAAKTFVLRRMYSDRLAGEDRHFKARSHFIQVIQNLLDENPDVFSLSEKGQSEQSKANAISRRVEDRGAQIFRIDQGKPQYAAFDKRWGQVRNFNSDELQLMSQEQLDAVEAAVNGLRRARGAKPVEQATSRDSFGEVLKQKPPTAVERPKVFIPHPDDPSREPTQSEMIQILKKRTAYVHSLVFPGGGRQQAPGVSDRINAIIRGEV